MALAAGFRLGPYQILDAIGAGGMGEVYKARDTRLDRTVAIKVLPSHIAANPEARQRFEREARAVSSLNHPHICVLHDIGRQDGIDFLVMEYLEGETLAARLAKGAPPLDQVLRYAVQIADALAQAHTQGVFHRDLKPGNIMLTKSGSKLLDFGLAKVGASSQGVVDTVLTVTAGAGPEALTEKGTILGTFQYMAPEQVEGKEADGRSDIFAFGAVVYEMATGKKAFEGKSAASMMAAILERDPPAISTILPMAPPALDRVVRKCLAKDPDERWQSARDLKSELEWIAEGSHPAAPPGVTAPPLSRPAPRFRKLLWPAAAGVFFLAALLVGVLHFREQPPEVRALRFSVPPPEKGIIHTLALSPDGRYLAMAIMQDGRRSLWVRPLDTLDARPVAGTEDARYPFWSADSSHIGFFAQGKLKKIAVGGGPPQTLCDAPDARGGTWNRDGVIVFSPDATGALQRVAATGGVPAPATRLDSTGGGIHRFPVFLPDGRHFLFVASLNENREGLYLASLDSTDVRLLLTDHSSAAYAEGGSNGPGHLLFARDTTLVAQPFDAGRLQFAGEIFPVAERLRFQNVNHGQFSVSSGGTLAYMSGTAGLGSQLLWFDRQGKQIGAAAEPAQASGAALSPDEKRIVVQRWDSGGGGDLWLLEPARGAASRFTFGPTAEFTPVWSPDGRQIAYAAQPEGRYDMYLKASSGTGEPELLWKAEGPYAAPSDWSRDGRWIVFVSYDIKTKRDLWLLPLAKDQKPAPFLKTEFDETDARFSPDGRWLAYVSNETGRDEVYVQPVSAAGGKWQVSTGGGREPRWRGDGKELYFLAPNRTLMAAAVKANTTFEAGLPQSLFQTRASQPSRMVSSSYAVTADGKRFLISTPMGETETTPITVAVHWTAGLKSR